MKVVTDITILETSDSDTFKYPPYTRISLFKPGDFDGGVVDTIEIENITGVRFYNPATDEEIYIGYSKQVEEALGYPMEALENSKIRNQELGQKLLAMRQRGLFTILKEWWRAK